MGPHFLRNAQKSLFLRCSTNNITYLGRKRFKNLFQCEVLLSLSLFSMHKKHIFEHFVFSLFYSTFLWAQKCWQPKLYKLRNVFYLKNQQHLNVYICFSILNVNKRFCPEFDLKNRNPHELIQVGNNGSSSNSGGFHHSSSAAPLVGHSSSSSSLCSSRPQCSGAAGAPRPILVDSFGSDPPSPTPAGLGSAGGGAAANVFKLPKKPVIKKRVTLR